jgi:hypothetical protein
VRLQLNAIVRRILPMQSEWMTAKATFISIASVVDRLPNFSFVADSCRVAHWGAIVYRPANER